MEICVVGIILAIGILIVNYRVDKKDRGLQCSLDNLKHIDAYDRGVYEKQFALLRQDVQALRKQIKQLRKEK